ncbi:hypothetical protein RvY_12070 [Ramazzottius varieornatus]|uniref:Uncharacterized protein n=1 Tax=Ramazzottius varieornatus TaxID=947166 RepID=A0A1D1VI99_RAMVA|nr:hypothetical protein RvY_12070 [Ramazzottius varieornatus]
MARFTVLCAIAFLAACGSLLADGALMMFDDEVSNNLIRWPTDPKSQFKPGSSGVRPSWAEARVKIAYEISTKIPQADQRRITNAMDKLEDITRNCIQFDTFTDAPGAGFWHAHPVKIVPETVVCTTFNGKNKASTGQNMKMFSSQTEKGECLTQPRDTVRLLLNLLGLGNEYQRTDRRANLQMHPDPTNQADNSLTGGSGNFVLGENAHISTGNPFDIHSITMVNGDRFTKPGTQAFGRRDTGSPTFASDPSVVKLSWQDCENLNTLYRCRLDCDNSDVFTPFDDVASSKLLKPNKIVSNLNCWDSTDLDGDVPAGLGFLGNLQPVDDSVLPNKLDFQTDDAGSLSFTVVGPTSASTSRDVAVSLRRKRSTGLFGPNNKIVVTGKNSTAGNVQTYIEDEIGVELNCLPQFQFNGITLECGPEQGVGTSATDCTSDSTKPINSFPQPCQGDTFERLWLGPFVVTDPDFNNVSFAPQFRSVGVFIGEAAVPSFMWTWEPVAHPTALIGYVVKINSTPLPINATITVSLSVVDISSAMYGVNIPRPEPAKQDTVKGVPVIKTLTATFKVNCLAARDLNKLPFRKVNRGRL